MLLYNFAWVLLLLTNTYKSECREHEHQYLPYLRRESTRNYQEAFPDDDLLALSSSSGNKFSKKREKSSSISSSNDGEEKKTLAQQVAEGKYALIQNELFLKPPKRPGILSYEANSDIPNDTVHTLGGLAKKEIWLADSHLLVLTGGRFQSYETTDGGGNAWRPIDIFKAPKRPVKLSARPKVPPPFPVQLIEGGPLQILGTNSTRTLDESEKATTPLPPSEGYIPGSGPYFPFTNQDPSHSSTGQITFGNPSFVTETVPTPVFSLNSSSLPPHFASLPPGAVVLPPPNLTNMMDEDDPSIYYPPPYSFFYEVDNSTKVPPGPLVPGLILPPPPNFFAPLEETQTERARTVTTKTSISSKTSVRFRLKSSKKNQTTSTTALPTTDSIKTYITTESSRQKTKPSLEKTISPIHYNRPIFRARNRTIQRPVTIQRPNARRRPTSQIVTEKPTILPSRLIEEIHIKTIPDNTTPSYNNVEEVQTNKIKDETTPNSLFPFRTGAINNKINFDEPNTTPTSKSIPVKIYITPAYADDGFQKHNSFETTKQPNNNIYFEEKPKSQFIQIPKRTDLPYSTSAPDTGRERSRSTYNTPPLRTSVLRQIKLSPAPADDNSFKQHIDQIRNQIRKFQTNEDPFVPSSKVQTRHKPQPLYQYSFEANNYQEQHRINEEKNRQHHHRLEPDQKYTVKIQPAIEVTSQGPILRKSSPYLALPQDIYRSTSRPIVEEYYSGQQEDQNVKHKPTKNSNIAGIQFPYYDIYVYDLQDRRELYETPAESLAWQRRLKRPVSLSDDINVNYNTRHLAINPNAEVIQIPEQTQHYPQQTPIHPQARPTPHQAARTNAYYNTPANFYQETVERRRQRQPIPRGESPTTAFISYKLPGDEEAHFYFLTPQQQEQNKGASYYYNNKNSNEGSDQGQ